MKMVKLTSIAFVLVAAVVVLAQDATSTPPAPAAPATPATAPAAVDAPAPKDIALDLGNGIGMRAVFIPAGTFAMGSPSRELVRDSDEIQHDVKLSKSYYIGAYPVTKGQFAQFVKDSGHKTKAEEDGFATTWNGDMWVKTPGATWKNPGFDQGDDHPVVCVSWNDATEFCAWLSKKSGKTVRLPTEAQWENACRAGTRTAYYFGDETDDGKGYMNGLDNTAKQKFNVWATFPWEDGFLYTSPVGKFKPNNWGLYDMHGNVWQWCSDWDADYPAGGEGQQASVTDPSGPVSGELRVFRGGSWISDPRACRSASRGRNLPNAKGGCIGFRVAVAD
ncbi:MAG: formylglycine-generating enzyme family protein [Planctomycetes bacterium]|nr:formylglycine-generating enzyme family protein [Planctomycetota bacterium]